MDDRNQQPQEEEISKEEADFNATLELLKVLVKNESATQ